MNIEDQKITDEQLMLKIRGVLEKFDGDSDDLTAAIGLVVLGHLMGWRFARFVLSRKAWGLATKLFGDLKLFLPSETKYSKKSYGLRMIETLTEFWAYVKGTKDAMPLKDKKRLDFINLLDN